VLTPFGEIPDRLASDMSLGEQHEWLAARMSRRAVLRGLLVSGAVAATPALWRQPARAAGAQVLSRMLTVGVDPSREVTVAVSIDAPFGSARVEARAGTAEVRANVDVQVVRGSSMRYGQARLQGLEPGTDYSYRVLLDGAPASTGAFRTAPAQPAPFRFTAFGDQGVGSHSAGLLRQVAALEPAIHLLAGDICYANQDGRGRPGDRFKPQLWDAWLVQNNPVAGTIPFLCALGNHEMEPGFDVHGYAGVLARMPLPSESPLECPASWSVRYGTVGFVGLDSNDVSHELPANRGYTKGEQTRWLKSTLADMRKPGSGVDFIVVILHHSPYSSNEAHACEGGVREEWVPLFDRYATDLVIAGHNHCYERTLPLRRGSVAGFDADNVDSTVGTTYVTAGGGGATATPQFIREGLTRVSTADGPSVESVEWTLPERTGRHAVLVADVDPGAGAGEISTLTLRAIDEFGQTLDTVVLQRRASDRPAVTAPAPGRDWTSTGLVVAGSVGAAALAAGGVAGAAALRRRPRAPVHTASPAAPKVLVRPLVERRDGDRPSNGAPPTGRIG
jgi:hypothetical protein